MFRKLLNIPKNADSIEVEHGPDDLFSPAAAPTSPQLKDPRLLPPKIIPHKYSTPSTKFFENKKTGVVLYYEVYGSGKEHVIFIVGLGAGWEWYDNQIEYFLQKPSLLKQYSILIFDNRGAGLTKTTKKFVWRHSVHDMASDAKALLKHLGWKDFHVISHSLGGVIAQELVLSIYRKAPEKRKMTVKSLSLLSTFNRLFSYRDIQSNRIGLFPKWSSFFVVRNYTISLLKGAGTILKKDKIGFYSKVLLPFAFSREFLEKVDPKSQRSNLDIALSRYRHMFDYDYRIPGSFAQIMGALTYHLRTEEFQKLTKEYQIPVLLASGNKDRMVPVQNTLRNFVMLAKAVPQPTVDPNDFNFDKTKVKQMVRLVILNGSGHLIQAERAKEVNQLLFHDWLWNNSSIANSSQTTNIVSQE